MNWTTFSIQATTPAGYTIMSEPLPQFIPDRLSREVLDLLMTKESFLLSRKLTSAEFSAYSKLYEELLEAWQQLQQPEEILVQQQQRLQERNTQRQQHLEQKQADLNRLLAQKQELLRQLETDLPAHWQQQLQEQQQLLQMRRKHLKRILHAKSLPLGKLIEKRTQKLVNEQLGKLSNEWLTAEQRIEEQHLLLRNSENRWTNDIGRLRNATLGFIRTYKSDLEKHKQRLTESWQQRSRECSFENKNGREWQTPEQLLQEKKLELQKKEHELSEIQQALENWQTKLQHNWQSCNQLSRENEQLRKTSPQLLSEHTRLLTRLNNAEQACSKLISDLQFTYDTLCSLRSRLVQAGVNSEEDTPLPELNLYLITQP